MSRDGSIFVYNPDVLRKQFAGLAIQRGLPFNHYDNEQTMRVFQNHLQPRYTHVSRTTLKRDAMKLWVMAKQAIIDGFLKINTNVNLTTDVWTRPHRVPGSYISVTAHWIEPDTWQMMKRVIAFEDFSAPHTGSALTKTLINVFVNFKLKNKIMSITLDNASNNTSAIGKLRLKYEPPMEEFLIESISMDLEFFDDSYATKEKNGSPTCSKAKETMFPVLSRMAMDILSVQDTSVAFESVFLKSRRVLSIRRTRLTPVSLEMSNEAIPLSDEEIALDAASSECSMSGPGSGGEEAEANYDYDVYHDDY
uniref:Zinc finger BED domain-containing protein DAYSLEEPER n=1 Tax=Tanacetum cinerariifolium TaxID=118510 RepID=A0A6L2KT79_TANCI|nr:zinc finger BED domain-containing protein DAYSLEEPER [Tanacetum cinerariifolium]